MGGNSAWDATVDNFKYVLKWSICSILIGIVVGGVGILFRRCVDLATANWKQHPYMVFTAPVFVVLVILLTRLLGEHKNRGTNTVIESVSEDAHNTGFSAPMIFGSTVLSHLAGASVGKEGAALMIGGSIGEALSRVFKLDDGDKRIAIMCGMSACFAAVFGTPLTAAIFPIEMISVGYFYYSALIPCMFSAFFSAGAASFFGFEKEIFPVTAVPEFGFTPAVLSVSLGILCAVLAIGFSILLLNGHHAVDHKLPNVWVRAMVGSVLYILLWIINQKFLTGEMDFNGGGFQLVEKAMEGETAWYALFLKILFTFVCIAAGFKGGEIVPTLAIGACLGSLFAGITSADTVLFTACGMTALFAGMTNCPIGSLFLAFELFGYAGMPYFFMSIAVSFTLSGYYGLYTSQKFACSKTKNRSLNRKGPRHLWKDEEEESQ